MIEPPFVARHSDAALVAGHARAAARLRLWVGLGIERGVHLWETYPSGMGTALSALCVHLLAGDASFCTKVGRGRH